MLPLLADFDIFVGVETPPLEPPKMYFSQFETIQGNPSGENF